MIRNERNEKKLIQRYLKYKKLLWKVISQFRYLICNRFIILIFIILVQLCLFLASVPRFNSIAEWLKIWQVSQFSQITPRCREINESHAICLPNIYFIGASKSGTTSMVEMLKGIPYLKFTNRYIIKRDHHSEIHRFDREMYRWSLLWIELNEEYACSPIIQKRDLNHTFIIHYTPSYLYAPTVPFDLRKFHPHQENIKFLVMLRNPVDRAWSSYSFYRSHLFTDHDSGSLEEFENLSNTEIYQRRVYDKCFPENIARCSRSENLFSNLSIPLSTEKRECFFKVLKKCFGSKFRSPSLGQRHVDKSIYIDQFLRWFANFPRNKFFIMKYEDWVIDPRNEIFRFLQFIGYNFELLNKENNQNTTIQLTNNLDFYLVKSERLKKPNAKLANATIERHFRSKLEDFFSAYEKQLASLF